MWACRRSLPPLAVLLPLLSLPSRADAPSRALEVSVEYGVVARVKSRADSVFPVRDGTVLSSGDQIRISLKAAWGTLVYVVAQMSSGDYLLLHSQPSESADTSAWLPWLVLDDHPGVETIHLIASHRPLSTLEEEFSRAGTTAGIRSARVAGLLSQYLDDLHAHQGPAHREVLPLASIADLPPLGWRYRGLVGGQLHGWVQLTRLRADSLMVERIRIIHE